MPQQSPRMSAEDKADFLRAVSAGTPTTELAARFGISERHAYRVKKKLLTDQRDGLLDQSVHLMLRWTLYDGIKSDAPANQCKYLLETSDLCWVIGEVDYAWWIHQIKPGLSDGMVKALATTYMTTALAASGSKWQYPDWSLQMLDLALTTEPWLGEAQARLFAEKILRIRESPPWSRGRVDRTINRLTKTYQAWQQPDADYQSVSSHPLELTRSELSEFEERAEAKENA